MMKVSHEAFFSKNFIQLFNKENNERIILDIMNLSKLIFPNEYVAVEQQSHGECDYIDKISKEKYDAKLPFKSDQIKMLTNGKRHAPEIEEWLAMMQDESASFSPLEYRSDPDGYIERTQLYKIMREKIEKDKEDENIVFFIPYPVTLSIRTSIFLQATSDYMDAIYGCLDKEDVLKGRHIYAIYPSDEKNCFLLRNLARHEKEYVEYDGAEQFFSYEITDISV